MNANEIREMQTRKTSKDSGDWEQKKSEGYETICAKVMITTMKGCQEQTQKRTKC